MYFGMRLVMSFIFGLCWITVKSQNTGSSPSSLPAFAPAIIPASSISIAPVYYNPVSQSFTEVHLLRTDYMKLDLPGDRDTEAPGSKSHLQAAVNYQTDDVYNGRKSNRVIPLITPQVSYIFKNGFQTDLGVGYDIHDPSPQVNQYTFDVSYIFSPGNGNFSSSFTASRFFYSDQSGSTTAEQRGSFEIDNSYDFGFIAAEIDLSSTYGDGKDYGATFSLQHEFDSKDGKLSLVPAVSVDAGTQNYYDSYYHNRKYRIGEKDNKPVYEKVLVYGDVLNAGKFQVLCYEWSAAVNYTAGRLDFNFTPTYSLPVNPADILITTSYNAQVISTKLTKEKLSNTIYVQLGITYSF